MPKVVYSGVRHLSAPFDGPRVAGAQFQGTVYVWDLRTGKPVSTFETALDFGGRRLAINPRGDICAVGSFRLGGVSCFATDTGEEICIRDDLTKVQYVSYSPDGRRLYCGLEKGPLTVLDAETGADLDKYASTKNVYASPFQPIELLDKRSKSAAELRAIGGRRIALVPRGTLGVLDVAFAPDRFCMSESTSAVRCFGTDDGAELWRHIPQPGWHALYLAFAPRLSAFFGVEWHYEQGGAKRLLRFEPESGRCETVATLKRRAAVQTFCARGELLLTSEGELIDVATGEAKRRFLFPPRERQD